ncbi:MAG: hypothetical protein ISR64_07935 [Deltaproteobacteria bacterium]|nr:hypothetical protein [Deltaproteobacteria bacterium]
MGQTIRLDERTLEVDRLEKKGQVIHVDLDGHEISIPVGPSTGDRHQVTLDGRSETLYTAVDGNGTWVWCRGRSWLVQDGKQATRRARHHVGDDPQGGVTPPMPAVVVSILVVPGDVVEKGQELVVVTAMKMETRLVAGQSGKVTSINTEVGANVRPGDVLVTIESNDGEDGDE